MSSKQNKKIKAFLTQILTSSSNLNKEVPLITKSKMPAMKNTSIYTLQSKYFGRAHFPP